MKLFLRFSVLLVLIAIAGQLPAQCSSLYTTPEFPVGTHPSDGNTQSWGANIFTPTQMGGPATFTGLQIYVDNSYGPTTYANQTVWLRHTAVSSYPNAQYPTTVGFTQCFSGSYSFPMSGLYSIVFNVSSFAYNGSSNLEILFENRSNVYRANEPWFRRTTSYGAGVYRSKWNGNFGFGGFPGTASDGSAVRLTYTLSLTAAGGSGCGSMLPVSFPSFFAVPEGRNVRCVWDLEGESDQPVLLERSFGSAEFEVVSSTEPGMTGHFEWVDETPNPGVNLYRLRSTDSDGAENLSTIMVVDMAPVERASLYAHGQDGILEGAIMCPDDRQGMLRVMDLNGRLLFEDEMQLEAGRNHFSTAVQGFSGLAIVQVQAGDELLHSRVFIP